MGPSQSCTLYHGWFPTTTALVFVDTKGSPDCFFFHSLGLSATDGNLTLKLPTCNQDSYTVMEFQNKAQEGTMVTAPVLSVDSMLICLNQMRLAILKIDIEGAKFDVIHEWSKSGCRPPTDQLLI